MDATKSHTSRKFAQYNDALANRKFRRGQGYKTGHIYKNWQGMYSFQYGL